LKDEGVDGGKNKRLWTGFNPLKAKPSEWAVVNMVKNIQIT
jgi:hypothetical protein